MDAALDAFAMIAFLRGEPGADGVESLFLGTDKACIAHAINLCEVYYDFIRATDGATALAAIADLESSGLVVRQDMDPLFRQEAGRYKATLVRVSLADCFAIALTQRVKAELVTSDHHEFEPQHQWRKTDLQRLLVASRLPPISRVKNGFADGSRTAPAPFSPA